jgi:homocysteine S-methyltransferase
MDLLEILEDNLVPGDGAMGTMIIEAGIPRERCFEQLCLSHPDIIRSIHERYVAAGSRLIKTNSFGANALRLEEYGFGRQVNEINWCAARLAREMARGKDVCVAGSVGPLGVTAGQAKAAPIDRKSVFQEQIGALLDGGADVIFLETFTDLDELMLALYVKQSLHHCPVICSMSCLEEGRLPDGMPLAHAFRKLREAGADIVGANCQNGPQGMLRLFQRLPIDGLLSAYPNAGYPKHHDGRYLYSTSPEDFANAARGLVAQGARLIGGCCGIGPDHIAAMVQALKELEPVRTKATVGETLPPENQSG